MKTAVGYIRVSTSGQLDNTSLEDQAEQITKYCVDNDLELILPLYDEGWQSGADNDRPQLQKMLADADQKKFEVVIINSLDRFGREMVDMLINIRLLERAGVELISVKEKFGNDPLGKLVRNTLANYAEFEKAIIKDRTHKGRNKRRKNKDIFIGRTAHGYRWNKIEKRIETIDDEAKTVNRIFREYLNLTQSIPEVVETLHKEHILTRSGKNWTIALVAQLLRNPCYTGTYWTNKYVMNAKGKVIGEKPESEWVAYPCEALITQTDWARLQKRLDDARDKFSGAPNPESKKYIADGLLRCGLCNGTMRLRHTRPNKSGTRHSYYSCYWRIKSQRMAKLYGKTQCTMPLIPAHVMDEKLFDMSLPLKLGLVWEEQYEDKVNPSIDVDLDKAKQRVENIKTSISRNKTALTNHEQTQYAEEFDAKYFNNRRATLNREQEALNRELTEAEREYLRYQQLFQSEQSFKRIAADKDTIMELFRQVRGLPLDQKRRLLKGLVDGDIIVKPPTPDAVLEIEEGPNALNKWVNINWRYNPAIIQDILGVKIVSEVETTREGSGWVWIRVFPPQDIP
jgi:site-specific DNA recombinase